MTKMRTSICSIALFFAILQTHAQTVTATFDDVQTKRVAGDIGTYISKSGETFKVGDTITIGSSKHIEFANIWQNAGLSYYPIENSAAGSKVIVKSIKAQSRVVYLNTTKPSGYVYGLRIKLESALEVGEVASKQLTSSEALQLLKNEKDKLDLGLITQEEYEKRKAELSKFIK
jgi:hypothetical protein